jgi:hypothetical protein
MLVSGTTTTSGSYLNLVYHGGFISFHIHFLNPYMI